MKNENTSAVYQYTMNHLENQIIFKSRDDYVTGVNSIAFGTLEYNVKVLGYTLMSNHLHLLLCGTSRDCLGYYQYLVRRLRSLLGLAGMLKTHDSYNVTTVTSSEMFRNELCYILRNCYKARFCCPTSYPWSSVSVYFNPWLDCMKGNAVGALSQTERREFFSYRKLIPPEWEYHEGRILDKFFIDRARAEKQFTDSVQYFNLLRKYDLESIVASYHGIEETLRFPDEELLLKATAICNNEYHVATVKQLDNKTLLLLAKALSRRYMAPKSQISRILSIPMDTLDKLL